jgi:hypothetical protein
MGTVLPVLEVSGVTRWLADAFTPNCGTGLLVVLADNDINSQHRMQGADTCSHWTSTVGCASCACMCSLAFMRGMGGSDQCLLACCCCYFFTNASVRGPRVNHN